MDWNSQEVVDYVVGGYDGLVPRPDGIGNRRSFIWLEDDGIYQGNAEAFALHVGRTFSLSVTPQSGAARIHTILIAAGLRAKDRGPIVNRGAGSHGKSEPSCERVGTAEVAVVS